MDTIQRYIAFDVETPNARNDRMSAIGVSVIENGGIVDSFGTLIDPETHFDRFNIMLTGIRPSDVDGAPRFPELWAKIRPLMESGVLLAHNATFDLRVLSCCLQAYGLEHLPVLPYACTVQMGRRCYPSLENHRLNTLCDFLQIPLDHHRADSDALACAMLFVNYCEQGMNPAHFIRQYRIDR